MRWNPVALNGLSTDLARLLLDIRVIYFSLEEDLRAFEGVIVCEIEGDYKVSTSVRRIGLIESEKKQSLLGLG